MAGWPASHSFRNDYRNKIEASGYGAVAAVSATAKRMSIGGENVPKAVVVKVWKSALNVPVSDTVNWTNNVTYMLQSKTKKPAKRLSIIPQYTA